MKEALSSSETSVLTRGTWRNIPEDTIFDGMFVYISVINRDVPSVLKLQRKAVFKWIGAIVLDLGRDGLPPLAHQLLAPLSRELVRTDESDSGKELCQLAKEVSDLIKKKLGMEAYTRLLSRLQINLAARRADRKKLRAQEVSWVL
jgi:hypothetical protein